jgi:ABC-type sugar transport system, periplasmic component
MGEDTFAELSGDWTKDYSDTILQSPKQTANGKLLCAPFGDVTTFGMCYNKKVFADNNITIPETWDELMKDCETFKKAGITPIYTSGAAGNEWTLQILSIDARAKMMLTEPGSFDKLNSHAVKWADDQYANWMLTEFKGLIDKGYTQDSFLSDTYADAQEALLSGTAAMYPQATWIYSELAKIAQSKEELDNIGMFAIPSKDGSATVAYTETPTGFLVPAAGKNVELAKQIVGALASKDAMAVYYQNHSGVPSVNGINVDLIGIPKDVYTMIEAGKTQSQPYMVYSVPSLATDIQAMLAGDKKPVQVLQGTDKDWDTYAKDNKNADWGY